MSWSYSGDPADSDLDAVRFYIQDIDTTDQLLSDEAIEFMIAQWTPVYDNVIMIAAQAAEIIAAKFAREVSYSADGVSVGVNELQSKYEQLALSLRDQYKQFDVGGGPEVYGVMYSEYPDPMIKPTLWSVGMHDNYRAGAQDADGVSQIPIPEIGGSY